MKKRILIIVLLYVMMLCLSSCGKTKDSFNTDTYTTDKQVEDSANNYTIKYTPKEGQEYLIEETNISGDNIDNYLVTLYDSKGEKKQRIEINTL